MIIIRPIEVSPGLGDKLIDSASENFLDFNSDQVYVFGEGIMYSSVDPVDYGEDVWESGTTYDEGDIVTVLGSTQRRYESLTDYNTGNDPTSSPTEWLDLGATNRWRMFDGGTSTLTSDSEQISIRLKPSGFANALAMFNVDASSIRVIVSKNGDVAYDEEVVFVLEAGESNWWSWFFGSVIGVSETSRDHVVLGIPGFFEPTIDVIFSRPGGTVRVGLLVVGRQERLGVGIYGTSVGIRDFSTKEVDTFGNFTVVQRRFAKRAEVEAYIETAKVATVQQALASVRATPTVYIGSEKACLFCPDQIHTELILYGYYSDFEILLVDEVNSSGLIELEGL